MNLFRRSSIYANAEFQAALVRLGLWFFALVYVSASTLSGHYVVDIQTITIIFTIYLLFFLGLLVSVSMRPAWEERRYLSMVLDISATSVCILMAGEATSPFFLLYIWTFVSYGTRYGQRNLMVVSVVLCILAYSVVLTLLEQWGKYSFEATFILLVLGILPMYQYSLMGRLRRACSEAEESNRLMGRFLSNITNDMRAPLADIIDNSNVLAGSGLNMRQLDKLEEIGSSAALLDAVIGDVLDFSKIEAQQLQIQAAPFNLQSLLSEVCLATTRFTSANRIEFVCSMTNDLPKVVVGDEQRLKQILINIIKTVINTSAGGELLVTVSMDDSDPGVLLFEINGMEQASPPYQKAEMNGSDLTSGEQDLNARGLDPDLGIGLARRLVQKMGGKFGSAQGESGATFWLRLPVELSEFELNEENRFSSLQGKKVFVFETNTTSRQVIIDSCEQAGMIVESVGRMGELGDAMSESREWHDIDVILIADSPEGRDVARIADICLDVLGKDLPLVILAYRRNCLDPEKYRSAILIKKPFILNYLLDAMSLVLEPDPGPGRDTAVGH